MSSPFPPIPRDPAGRRARGALTRDAIVDAAVEVLDERGLDGLTMRAVANRLGAGAMSLYRHVSGRDELLDLAVARLLADAGAGVSQTGDWRVDLAGVARAVREALLARPALTVLLTARAGMGSAGLATMENVLGILRMAGFDPLGATLANHALGNFVAGSALWEAVGMGGTTGPERQERLRSQAAALAALPADAWPNLAWVGRALFEGTADDRFEFGLEVVIDGLAARLADGDR